VWRDHQLEASTSRPGHSASKFGTGDSRTLRDQPAAQGLDVRARLLALHGAHYSASRMALVVLGREPLDELQALAAARFSAVPNNGSATPVEAAHPWGAGAGGAADGYCGLQQWVVPIKDTRTLTLSWAMPEVRSRFAAKPHSYLSHLLGHEGPGSVLSCLKGRGLATELSCGTNDSEAGYSTFSVQVALTADGLARADEVAAVVYAYVGLLRAHGPLRWVHDELAGTAAVSFRFRAKSRPINTVTRLAHSMLELPTAVAASGAYLLTAWDPAGVAELLRCLTPANSRVRLSAQALAERCPLTEPWYGVRYGQAPIGDELAARWAAAADGYEALTRARAGGRDGDGELAGVDAWAASLAPSLRLPEPNEFIAADFALKHPALAAREAAAAAASVAGAPRAAPREPVPVLLLDEPGRSVWHHLDDSFGVPKAYVHAELALPGGYASPRAIVLSDLYVRLLKEALSELAYAAELAELAYSAHATIRGVALTVGGFSHKLAALCARIGERVAGLAFTDAQFAIQLDRAVREAANWDFSQPYQLAAYDASVATCAPKWHLDERRRVLAAGVGADELRRFIAGTLLATAHATVLVSGNAAPGDALALADVLLAPLAAASTPPAPAQLAGIRIVALPAPTPLGAQPSAHHVAWEFVHTQPARNPRDPNAALDLLLQVGPQGAGPQCSGNALVDLAAHMLAEPFFDTLRTKQALGYIVMCASKSEGGVDWLRFLVQSNKVAPGELVERTEAFLAAFAASLRALPPAKFASNVEAVVSKKLEADKSLSEEAARLWGEVRDGTLDFARASQEVAALRSLCQADFVRWFDDVVAPGGARRRFFASLVEAGGGGGAGGGAEAGEAAAAAAAADDDDDDEEAAEADAAMAEMGGEGEDGGAGPLSPGLVPGQPAPTGGDGGLAREDRLAPLGVHADASAASAAVAQSPTTAACVAASRAARTLSVASGQAAAVLHALHSHAHVAGAPLAPVLAAAFASVGVDAAPQLAAAAAAGAALHVRVALGGVGDMRAVLPLHADAGAMRAAAWRHQRQQLLLQGGGQGAAAPA
jgi:insulysin